jgi:hypothetical protein
MRRLFTGLALVLAAITLFSCGGSSSAPNLNPGDNTGGNGSPKRFDVMPPLSSTGSHAVSIVPGQVNVLTGASETELTAIAVDHGYTVLNYDGGRATLGVPTGQEQAAAAELTKEYNVISAEPVNRINTRTLSYGNQPTRAASFYPPIPYYNDQVTGFNFDGTTTSIANGFIGQAQPLNMMGFNGAWDISMQENVAQQPVVIAIIDAGFHDYSDINSPMPGLDLNIIDQANSGSVDGTGTFTAGLPAAKWDMFDDDGVMRPVRDVGAMMFGLLAANPFQFAPRAFDLNGDTIVSTDEVWNEGMAGINSGVALNGVYQFGTQYILIKTGTNAGGTPPTWSFSDNELAESIDHAVTAGADIILLGMFGTGSVGAALSTAIQNARDNDVLVIAPAGDVVQSLDDTGNFTETPVDITSTEVSPASDPNVVSVSATGLGRIADDSLNDVDFGGGPIDNLGNGWDRSMTFNAPFDSTWDEVASFSNTGGTIAAVGFGMGFGARPFLQGGTPASDLPGVTYGFTLNRFGSHVAAAYVAGAASQVFQAMSVALGAPPTDDQVLNELLSTTQFTGGIDLNFPNQGLLNANLATISAFSGGDLVTVLPAMEITSITASQPFAAVTRGTDFSLTADVSNGTAPFTLSVDWDNGAGPVVVDPWNNGDPVELSGGYDTLGIKGINLIVEDSTGRTANFPLAIRVINPLAASITVEDAAGILQNEDALSVFTSYNFKANPANVYTGEGNVTTFTWDFGDGTPTETGPVVDHAFQSEGPFTVTLTITETVRPDTVRTLDVTVVP